MLIESKPCSSILLTESVRHCPKCRQVIRSQLQLQRHKESGACDRFFCRQENHAHDIVDESFETLIEAKAYITQTELDKFFIIKWSVDGHVLYRCRHYRMQAITPPIQSDSEKHKRKKTCVPALGCTAVLRIDQMTMCQCLPTNDTVNGANLGTLCLHQSDRIRVRGCLTHSHGQEIRFLRMSQVDKDFYISMLNLGLSKDTILQRFCNSDRFESLHSKVTTLQDLRNLERLYVDTGLDREKSDIENVCKFLERKEFRGFSFESLELRNFDIPIAIKSKQFTTENHDTVIVYASNAMLKDFEANPTTIFIDGTHGTNRSQFAFISILVFGKLFIKIMSLWKFIQFHLISFRFSWRGNSNHAGGWQYGVKVGSGACLPHSERRCSKCNGSSESHGVRHEPCVHECLEYGGSRIPNKTCGLFLAFVECLEKEVAASRFRALRENLPTATYHGQE